MFKLHDKKTKLTCHVLQVSGDTEELAEELREMFITSMTNYGYTGFDHDIDNIFHYRSTYLYITDQESSNIVMVVRVTPRPTGTFLPFEMGLLEDGRSYKLTDAKAVADINTYTYVRGHYYAMPLITAGFGYCANMLNAQEAYCLFDEENDSIRDKYLSIRFKLSEEFPDPIIFQTFRKKKGDSDEPVRWRIMKWDYPTIKHYANLAKEFYDFEQL